MYRVSASRALSNARSTLVRRSEAVAPANAEKLLEAGKGDWKAMSIADKAARMLVFSCLKFFVRWGIWRGCVVFPPFLKFCTSDRHLQQAFYPSMCICVGCLIKCAHTGHQLCCLLWLPCTWLRGIGCYCGSILCCGSTHLPEVKLHVFPMNLPHTHTYMYIVCMYMYTSCCGPYLSSAEILIRSI